MAIKNSDENLLTGDLDERGLARGLDDVLEALDGVSRHAIIQQLKAGNLLGFQKELSAKMLSAEAEYDALIGFEAGGIKFLVSAMDIAGIYDVPQITPVPVSEKWMSGVASLAGEVCMVTNFGEFIKKTPVNMLSAAAKILIPRSDTKSAIAIDKVTYLTPRNALKVSITKQDFSEKPWLLASYKGSNGESMVEVDINVLLASDEFLTAWTNSTSNS